MRAALGSSVALALVVRLLGQAPPSEAWIVASGSNGSKDEAVREARDGLVEKALGSLLDRPSPRKILALRLLQCGGVDWLREQGQPSPALDKKGLYNVELRAACDREAMKNGWSEVLRFVEQMGDLKVLVADVGQDQSMTNGLSEEFARHGLASVDPAEFVRLRDQREKALELDGADSAVVNDIGVKSGADIVVTVRKSAAGVTSMRACWADTAGVVANASDKREERAALALCRSIVRELRDCSVNGFPVKIQIDGVAGDWSDPLLRCLKSVPGKRMKFEDASVKQSGDTREIDCLCHLTSQELHHELQRGLADECRVELVNASRNCWRLKLTKK